jgi:hypothetical protein
LNFKRSSAVRPIFCVAWVIAFCLSFVSSRAGSTSENTAQRFLDAPSQTTFLAASGPCGEADWQAMILADPDLDQLSARVAQGNPWAARYLLRHLHQCDGGALESAFIALGQFGDQDMEMLLSFAHLNLLTKPDLSNAVGSTPIDYVDRYRAQLRFLDSRRREILRVKKEDLLAQKACALQAVDDEISVVLPYTK